MLKTWTVEELGGSQRATAFVVPAGIGDISWVYSKVRHLKRLTGRDVILMAPEEVPERSVHFVPLLPDVLWGGHARGVSSWHALSQSLPADWPAHMETSPLLYRERPINLAANLHLECGRRLSNWLPLLPTDYHYPLSIPDGNRAEADSVVREQPLPLIAVYVSNRDKENYTAGGWNLWDVRSWVTFLNAVARLPECANASFILTGADYDADKTREVADGLRQMGRHVLRLVGRPLGVALEVLRRCNYCFAYPSGIGVLANVLRTPALMLLPWILKGLERAYADPADLDAQRYRAWANPYPEEALRWFRDVSMPQVLAESGGSWPRK